MSSVKKFQTLKNKEFGYVYNKAKKKFNTKFFLLFYIKSDFKKIGFVASKKVGNAVKRNFAKRRLRALLGSEVDQLNDGYFVFVAKKEILDADYKELEKLFEKAFKYLNVYI